jgi:nucleoside-diphosphate-sugar epimerase
MKICVSGATGFIGSALMRYLASQGVEAIALTRMDCDATSIAASATNRNALINKLANADAIIHLAGRAHVLQDDKAAAPRLFNESNVELTVALARVALEANVKRFVFVSSIGVCGDKTTVQPFTEDSPALPSSEYAASKLRAELRLQDLLHGSPMEWTIIRPPMVYSAIAPGNFHRLLKLVYSGVPLPFGRCMNARSMIAVENLVSFMYACATHPEGKDQLFLVADISLSTQELVHTIADGMQKRLLLMPISERLSRTILTLLNKPKLYTQLFESLQIDNSKACRLLNWQPDDKRYLQLAGAKFKAIKQRG